MTDDARMFNSIKIPLAMIVMIVSHLVIMAKARSKDLVRLQYPMT